MPRYFRKSFCVSTPKRLRDFIWWKSTLLEVRHLICERKSLAGLPVGKAGGVIQEGVLGSREHDPGKNRAWQLPCVV